MSNTNAPIERGLKSLYYQWAGTNPGHIIRLPHSGSKRVYYRLQSDKKSAIGVYNDQLKENIAFIHFTEQFLNFKLNVPQIYAKDLNQHIYLISDLGDLQLLKWVKDNKFTEETITIYKKTIQELVRMQILAGRTFDYSKCYPYKNFNKESIVYDLNYFRSKFVDAVGVSYNSQTLLAEFEMFSEYLLSTDKSFFMYRDFQSRNILIRDGEPYFIDYQGGRQGALQYDLASLLFQAKAQIPENIKLMLLEYYIKVASLFTPIREEEFIEYYYAYALVRVLQTMGTYGLRGIVEKKQHFLESIPFAINNLIYLHPKVLIIKKLPELRKIILEIINNKNNTIKDI